MNSNPFNPAAQPYKWLEWEAAYNVPAMAHIAAWQDRLTAVHREMRRQKAAIKAAKRAEERAAWTVTVRRILDEVRRREAEWARPDVPFFTSDNPLDGERLWA